MQPGQLHQDHDLQPTITPVPLCEADHDLQPTITPVPLCEADHDLQPTIAPVPLREAETWSTVVEEDPDIHQHLLTR